MRHRLFLLSFLLFLLMFFLSVALLARQNNQIHKYENNLFQREKELVSVEKEIRLVEEEQERLHQEIRILTEKEYTGKTVLLTFDDGPSYITEDVLDILKEKEAPAIFFINGVNVNRNTEICLTRAVEEGHLIGNHTYSHDYGKIYNSADSFMEDFNKNERLIRDICNRRSMFVRFPGGSRNSLSQTSEGALIMDEIKKRLNSLGYIYIDWNVTAHDDDPATLVALVEKQALWRNQVTILFHDRGDREVLIDALPIIIDDLKSSGFTFELIDPSRQVIQF